MLAALAIEALTAGMAGIDRDRLADFEARHALPDHLDGAGDLVAEDHRLAHAHHTEAAVLVVVQVGATNSAGADPHLHLAGTDGR